MQQEFKKHDKILLYILFDLIGSLLVWTIVYLIRYFLIDANPSDYFTDVLIAIDYFPISSYIVPFCWILVFFFSGDYNKVYKKSRVHELGTLFLKIGIGSFIMFILFIVNDVAYSQIYFITIFFIYYSLQYIFIAIGRLIVLTSIKKDILKKNIKYNTIIISDNPQKSLDFINKEKKINLSKEGIEILGYVLLDKNIPVDINHKDEFLGYFEDFETIIADKKIHLTIINLFSLHRNQIYSIINILDEKDIAIKVVPNIIDIASGNVKADSILGLNLVNVTIHHIPEWEQFIKRFVDISFSLVSLIVLLPFLIYIAIRVKLSSKGPIFYSQERIGYKETPFILYKFRSMYQNAERDGPQLTKENDKRITHWGKTMRKWRLDELPQLWNTLIGNMSLVGPRPERKYFLDQLKANKQYTKMLFKVKPGITSLGMVKFGYANTIEEIQARMKYDFIYIENTSLVLDFSILFLTISTVLKGKGK